MSKKTTLFVHDCSGINPGDEASCPLPYFDFSVTNNIKIESKRLRRQEDMAKYLEDKDNIIFGGGGLIAGRVKNMFSLVQKYKKKKHKIISWGIGYNERGENTVDYSNVKKYMKGFDIHGVRDFGHEFNYVPCSSCMHNVFNQIKDPICDLVVYEHYGFPIPYSDGYPIMQNTGTSLEEIIKFLSSGETIVTSAFHGAYWGMLLNRKVIVIPCGSRFFGFKHDPIFKTNNNWKKGISQSQNKNYKDYLLECRNVNKEYYKKVIEIINK